MRGKQKYSGTMNQFFLKFFYLFAALFIFISNVSAQILPGACNIDVKTSPVGGGTIEYLKAGSGTPILLLHGLFCAKGAMVRAGLLFICCWLFSDCS